MKKIWITRRELGNMIREVLPDVGPRKQRGVPPSFGEPKRKLPPFEVDPNLKRRVLSPEPGETEDMTTRDMPSKPKPSIVPGGDISRSKLVGPKGQRDPTASEPYSKGELGQGLDVTGDEPSDVLPSAGAMKATGPRGLGRSRLTPPSSVDPSATEPYSKRDLAQGTDVAGGPKKPGIVDRIKGMLGGDAASKGYEEPPSHWTAQQKEKFHRDRAISLRDRTKQYAKMFADANQGGDEKKRAYAKKMHAFYSNASNAHEKALRGAKQ